MGWRQPCPGPFGHLAKCGFDITRQTPGVEGRHVQNDWPIISPGSTTTARDFPPVRSPYAHSHLASRQSTPAHPDSAEDSRQRALQRFLHDTSATAIQPIMRRSLSYAHCTATYREIDPHNDAAPGARPAACARQTPRRAGSMPRNSASRRRFATARSAVLQQPENATVNG